MPDTNVKMFDNESDYTVIDGRKIFIGNGGAGSDNFGHSGRPGERGGSGGGGGEKSGSKGSVRVRIEPGIDTDFD